MPNIRISSVIIAMVAFAVGAILGLTIPAERYRVWLGLGSAVFVGLFLIGKFGKNRQGALTLLEIFSNLLPTFVGGLITAQLSVGMSNAQKDGAEGFFEMASHILITNSQGLFIALGLVLYGLSVILQAGTVGFVESRRKKPTN